MHRKVLAAAIMLFMGLISYCQMETFYATINTIPYAQGQVKEIVKSNDNNLILLISNLGPGTPDHLMKVDTLGNILWEKQLIRENNIYGSPNSMIETIDSGLIVASRSSNSVNFTIVKVNKNGNYEWAMQSDQSESGICYDLASTSDGGFAMVNSGCTWRKTIAKFNASGTNQWKYQLINPQQPFSTFYKIISDSENTLVVSGINGGEFPNKVSLCSVDDQGNLMWYKTFEFPGTIWQTTGLLKSYDKGYTISGTLLAPGPIVHPFLIHTDSTGTLQWAKAYNHDLQSTANALIQTADSGYVISGNILYDNSLNVQMLNIKTDRGGNIDWAQSFGNEQYNGGGYDNLFCSDRISNKYFYTAGVGEHPVLVKIDVNTGIGSCYFDDVNYTVSPISLIEDEPTIDILIQSSELIADTFYSFDIINNLEIVCSTLLEIEEFEYKNEIKVYPNPTQSTFTIEMPTLPSKNTLLTLSNSKGQQLITKSLANTRTEIDIHHFTSGIYILKVWSDKNVMVQKVIKQ